jgi:uncharacterized protein YjeT (DUF2065 family)
VRKQDLARIALGIIRSINGLAALFTPKRMVRRLGGDTDTNGIAIYVLRMFGIRTVLLGAQLFLLEGERRQEALRTGVVIHASDATAALIAGVTRQLPRKIAALVFAISSVNTALAVVAQRDHEPAEWSMSDLERSI